MFLSDSVDFSCLIAKSVGQYNAQNDIFLANITRNYPSNDVTKLIDLRDNFSSWIRNTKFACILLVD
jgi:hypothetical protein